MEMYYQYLLLKKQEGMPAFTQLGTERWEGVGEGW
jgi:hypothetical protein